MIKGIQITQAANDNLLNSFWLLDSEKKWARCLCAKAEFAEDQVVAVSELGQIEYRELPVNVAPTVKVERWSTLKRKRITSWNVRRCSKQPG